MKKFYFLTDFKSCFSSLSKFKISKPLKYFFYIFKTLYVSLENQIDLEYEAKKKNL